MDFLIDIAYYDFSNIKFFRIMCKEGKKFTSQTGDDEIANFLGVSKHSYRERLIKSLNKYLDNRAVVEHQKITKEQYVKNSVFEDLYYDLIDKFKEEFAPEFVMLSLSGKNLINKQYLI